MPKSGPSVATSPSRETAPTGLRSFPAGPKGLPWPVVLKIRGFAPRALAILRDGRIEAVPPLPRAAVRQIERPPGFVWVSSSRGTWADVRRGHLVILRDRRVLWRSSRRYGGPPGKRFTTIEVSAHGVAFQVRRSGRLYMAPGRRRERPVGIREWPEAWVRSGNLVTVRENPSARTWTYVVRSPHGRRLATLATGLRVRQLDERATDEATGTVLFWTSDGDLMRTDGRETIRLSDYRTLGFSRQPSMYLLSAGLIELLSRSWREVILRLDGSVFATASAPADGSVAGFGDQVASSDGRAVAYVLEETQGGGATVYVIREGDQQGRPVYRLDRDKGVLPEWHGRWLLYAPPDAPAAAIDTTGRHPPIELPTLAPWLPGPVVRVSWATPRQVLAWGLEPD